MPTILFRRKYAYFCRRYTQNMKKKLYAALLAAGLYSAADAQYFYSNHPPQIKWNRIETQHLQIVYPEGLDSVAQRTANLTNFVYAPVTKSLQTSPRKISFFLFNQSAVSNGYVTPIGPMMAWYTTPMQDVQRLGSEDWFQTLAVHEYRHVTQFEKMDKGTTRVAHILFGAYGGAALGLLSHPIWFAEGDAVATETALTNAGRGRLPSFAAPLRAAVLEGKPHNYDRVYLGSYKYHYPNHYTLGYYLQVYGRRQNGELFWSEVLDRVSKWSVSPYRFSKTLKKKTGMKLTTFHNAAMGDLKIIWLRQEQGREFTPFTPLTASPISTHRNHTSSPTQFGAGGIFVDTAYTSYTNALIMPYSSLFSVKSGVDCPTEFVLIKNGKEEKLFNRVPAGNVTSSGNLLCWSEFISDKRYMERSYSDIYSYNIETKKIRRLTRKSKYFAPAISPDGTQIAAVEFTDMMHCSLKILDAQTGNVVQSHDAAPGEFFRTPSWESSGESLVFEISRGEQNVFARYTPASGARDTLYGPTQFAVNAPSVEGRYLLFNSPATGLDAIHAVDLDTHKEYVVAQTRFGAQNAVLMPDGKSICYENYSSDGFSIVQSAYDPASWKALESVPAVPEDYFRPLVDQEQGRSIFDGELPDSTFAVKKYSPLKNIVNVHSWAFIPSQEQSTLTLYSNDKLNQLSAYAGVTHNEIENRMSEFIGLSYMKYFPVITVEAIHGFRTDQITFVNYKGIEKTEYYHWQEKTASLAVELPFNFSHGHYTRAISLKWAAKYKSVTDMDIREQTRDKQYYYFENVNGVIVPLQFSAGFINLQSQAERDLLPNWGQTLQLQTEYAVPGISDFGAKKISLVGKQYIPGILPSHGLYLQAGYEWQDKMNKYYTPPSYMLFTRGYDNGFSDEWALARVGYLAPLMYPDVHIGGTLYFKRLYVEAFADYAYAFETIGGQNQFTSVGSEFTLDFIPFRWVVLPLSIGLRTSYRLEDRKQSNQFMFMKMTF